MGKKNTLSFRAQDKKTGKLSLNQSCLFLKKKGGGGFLGCVGHIQRLATVKVNRGVELPFSEGTSGSCVHYLEVIMCPIKEKRGHQK